MFKKFSTYICWKSI